MVASCNAAAARRHQAGESYLPCFNCNNNCGHEQGSLLRNNRIKFLVYLFCINQFLNLGTRESIRLCTIGELHNSIATLTRLPIAQSVYLATHRKFPMLLTIMSRLEVNVGDYQNICWRGSMAMVWTNKMNLSRISRVFFFSIIIGQVVVIRYRYGAQH